MYAVINDLSFCYTIHEKEELVEKVGRFIKTCRMLESNRCHNIDKIMNAYIGSIGLLYSTEAICDIAKGMRNRDEKRYFLSLMRNRATVALKEGEVFIHDGLESGACYFGRDNLVVSIESKKAFEETELQGIIENRTVIIKNISRPDHIFFYRALTGLRIYAANDVKHKRDRLNYYGKDKAGSPMDLTDEESQELLDKAIQIGKRLYGRKGERVYAFMPSGNSEYHGYLVDHVQDNIKTELDKVKWDK